MKSSKRAGKTKAKSRTRTRRALDGLIAAGVLLAAAGLVVAVGGDTLSNWLAINTIIPAASPNIILTSATALPSARFTPIPSRLDNTLNVLLLGSDRRPEETVWRTDVMMVVFLDRAQGRAAVLSLPRDLYVDIPTRGWDRLNIADFWGEYSQYPGGGPGLLARVIGDNFGIRIDHFARVDFEGFKRIVDTVGGIDVQVPCALEDDFIDPTSPTGFRHFQVNAGLVHMDGETALMFVRQRHGNGDLSRAQRQQRVIAALRSRLLSAGIVTRIPQLYNELKDTVQTDFSPLDLAQLAQVGATITPARIRGRVVDESMSYPWMTPDGKSVLVFDKDKVRAAVNDLFNAPALDASKVLCE